MGFLDSDLVNEAKDQFGGEAADAAQQAAGRVIGDDAAGSVVGGLSGTLGIQRTATATATTDDDAQNADDDSQGNDQADDDDDADDDNS